MTTGSSLINLGDLSKPATVLVEKVCNAVGIIYEPTQIKRRAHAEAEADKIKALAKIELTDLEQRAIRRLAQQESRKQENIEQITFKAAEALAQDANVEKLDEDWVAHFFKQCDTVSDKEMQSLWSRLLAGEATTPGTFSKRTVDSVSSIDKKDAALFTNFCQFAWVIGEVVPLIYDMKNEIYTKHGINFSSLKHLDAIGLISFESIAGYTKQGFGKYAHFFYYGEPLLIEFPADAGNDLEIGSAMFTTTGKELVSICGSSKNQDFQDWIVKRWFDQGLILSSVMKR